MYLIIRVRREYSYILYIPIHKTPSLLLLLLSFIFDIKFMGKTTQQQKYN